MGKSLVDKERAFTPSRVDADKIKSAMGVVIEVLEGTSKNPCPQV